MDLIRPKATFLLVSTYTPGTVLDAAAVVLTLLRTSKLPNLAALESATAAGDEVCVKLLSKFVLSDVQLDAIEKHRDVLGMLRHAPLVSLTHCPVCDAAAAVVGAAPTKCRMTLFCEGSPVKAAAARSQAVVPAVA